MGEIKGLILQEGLEMYTDMGPIFSSLHFFVKNYNWLISCYECGSYPDERIQFGTNYVWISGEELTILLNSYRIQFIWGVFSGFDKTITLEQVLKTELPIPEATTYWKNPLIIQHPLAEIELTPWDSGLLLVLAKNEEVTKKFKSDFPLAENLEEYNLTMEK